MPAPYGPREHDYPPPPLQLSTFLGHPDPNRLLNYLQKYPLDKEGKELDPDSRTWKVYVDEHESYDYDMVKAFRENIDALLVFAALFSSIVTGFVVPAAERLEPDNGRINSNILFEATQLLRANGNSTLINATPRSELHPDSITHTTADVCVAWMFFTSLALSLATGLVSILAKQWLQAFTALVPGDAKQRSLTRQFRFAGMQKWKFAEIVGFLPLLLHLSLLIFLVGLCVYVERNHWSFITMLGFVSLAAVTFYVVTAALPAVYLDCPYRIPILFISASACIYATKKLRFYVVSLYSSIQRLQKSLSLPSRNPHMQASRQSVSSSSGRSQEEGSQDATTPDTTRSFPHVPFFRQSLGSSSLSAQEYLYVTKHTPSLELLSLEWLYTQTTNASVQRIVLHALARALENYVCCRPDGAERIPSPLSFSLAEMHSFASKIIDDVSGPDYIADDIPLLLDFHLHSSHALNREVKFPGSRWLSLIDSPHLLAFTERKLMPLDIRLAVEGCTGYPLRIACYFDRWDFVGKHFNDFPHFQWTQGDSDGWLPLAMAAMSDKIPIELWERILKSTQLRAGIWKSVLELPLNNRGDRALHLLCYAGANLAKITSMEDFCSVDSWNIQRPDGQTPLHRLCINSDNSSERLEIAKYLLSKGADLGIVDSFQLTPLHLACCESHCLELLEALCSHLQGLKNGWDVINRRDRHGRTALHRGIFEGKLDFQRVQVMISTGADPNIVDDDYDLPLHIACNPSISSSPHREIIGILVGHTDDINMRNATGETPLDTLMKSKDASKVWHDTYHLMREEGAKLASELEPDEETERTEPK